MSGKFTGHLSESFFWKFTGYFLEINRKFIRNVREVYRKFTGSFIGHFPEMSGNLFRKLTAHLRVIYRNLPGNFKGNVREVSRICLEISWKCHGKLSEISRNFLYGCRLDRTMGDSNSYAAPGQNQAVTSKVSYDTWKICCKSTGASIEKTLFRK